MAGGDQLPTPPYQVESTSWARLLVRFDPTEVQRVLPAGLEPVDEHTGGYVLARATGGWGLGSFGKSVSWIDVKAYDSPDGSPGKFYWHGYVDGPGVAYSNAAFSKDYVPGVIGFEEIGEGRFKATAGTASSEPFMTVQLVRSASAPSADAGVLYCLGRHRSGQLSFSPVPYSGEIYEARVEAIEFSSSQDNPYLSLRPTSLLQAVVAGRVSWTYGFARVLVDPATRSRDGLLDLLAHLGRGAILFEENDHISAINIRAEEILRGDVKRVGTRLTAVSNEGRRAISHFQDLFHLVGGSPTLSEPVIIPRSGDRPPVLAMSMPANSGQAVDTTGRRPDAAIILLTDPTQSNGPPQSGPILQMFGLTPAEAKIASLSGTGLSRRQVAAQLQLSEATVRVTLSHVYDKLGASRHGELVRIVSQIEQIA